MGCCNETDCKQHNDENCFWMNKRPKNSKNYKPTIIEDIANVLSHGVFILPCAWMTFVLYNLSVSFSQAVTALLYGGALVQLLMFSTLHHFLSLTGHHVSLYGRFAHIGDRVAIFIFIAASYTPWLMLRNYNHSLNPSVILAMIWTAVAIGLTFQIFFHEQYQNVEVILYIAVGLGPSVVVIESICFNGSFELAIGGALYISGVAFYKMDGIIPFAHAIWHVFVMVAALTHYYAIYTHLYVDTHICNTNKPFFFHYVGL